MTKITPTSISLFLDKLFEEYPKDAICAPTELSKYKETLIDIKNALVNKNKNIRIAFVGSYNVGKTSIVNLLTNASLPVSANIETKVSHLVLWENNIEVVDTPGLQTENTDHTQETLEWFAKAHLVVYVFTPDLLTKSASDLLFSIIKKYMHNKTILLLMNKIDEEGHDVDIYKQDFRKIFDNNQLKFDDYEFAAISAKYEILARESVAEKNREFYSEKSLFLHFEQQLKKLVEKERISIINNNPIRKLWHLCSNIRIEKNLSLLMKKIIAIRKQYHSMEKEIQNHITNSKKDTQIKCNEIEGRLLTLLTSCQNAEEFEIQYKEEFGNLYRNSELCFEETLNKVTYSQNEMQVSNEEISLSLYAETQRKMENTDLSESIQFIKKKFKALFGENLELDDLATPTEKIDISKLSSVLSQTLSKVSRDAVYGIGKSLGYKFRPWQATNIASKMSKMAPVLNIIGALYDFYSMYKSKEEKQKYEEALIKARKSISETKKNTYEDICKYFNEIQQISSEIFKIYKDQLNKYIQFINDYQEEIKEKNNKLIEFSQHLQKDLMHCSP